MILQTYNFQGQPERRFLFFFSFSKGKKHVVSKYTIINKKYSLWVLDSRSVSVDYTYILKIPDDKEYICNFVSFVGVKSLSILCNRFLILSQDYIWKDNFFLGVLTL